MKQTIKSYVDVMQFLNEQINDLTYQQADKLLKILIQNFVSTLPQDWLDNELADEKPFYQKLASLLHHDNWDITQIAAQLTELDAIMDAMGENYPHNTDAYALALLTMVDYYLQFCEDREHFRGFTMGVVDEYLTMADFEADAQDTDRWLDYPQIAQAFDTVKHAFTQVKSTC